MPRAVVVTHVPVEGPYAIGDALERHGIEVATVLTGVDALPEEADDLAALVVMGGPQSAYSDDGFPTRTAELALLRSALGVGVPTLGVCLGAQLLAAAAGGAAVAGTAGTEIGWGPVRVLPDAASDPLFGDVGDELTVLHWHGDTVELPRRATLLASTDRYPNQAFRVAPRAWGLQFHLEVTVDAAAAFVTAFGGDTGIAEQAPRHLATLAPARDLVLDRFAAVVARRSEAPV